MDLFQVAIRWIQEAELRPRTLERYACSLRQARRGGLERVEDLERARVRCWISERRAAGVTIATCRRDLAALQSLVRWLEARGEVPASRVAELARLGLRARAGPPVRFLSAEELIELLAAAGDVGEHAELAVLLGACAGLRLGELRALWREDLELDVDAPFVRVERARQETKTARSRIAAIAPRAAAAIARAEALPSSGPLFPAGVTGRGRLGASALVGRFAFHRWLAEARAIADIPAATWLVLRHTYATRLADAGYSLHQIAGWLGNTARTCETHYAARVQRGDAGLERAFEAVIA